MICASACLCGINCKYSGSNNAVKDLVSLYEKGEVLAVCPEVEGGLSTPRPCAEIQGQRVINTEGIDVTEAYRTGAEICLKKIMSQHCDTVILKSKSPSCGCGEIYDGTFSHKVIAGDGIFAALLKKNQIHCLTNEEWENKKCKNKTLDLSTKK